VLAYRATASWFHAERAKQIVRQRCVEVLAYFNLTLQTSQHPALIQALTGHKPGARLTGFRNNYSSPAAASSTSRDK
jgi:hypothetical protein